MSPRVFLSHKKCDAKWTKQLRKDLEACGIECFFDEDMAIGEFWRSEIDRAAAAAERGDSWLVLVASPEALASREVLHELAVVGGETTCERVLVLVREPTRLLEELKIKQFVDVTAADSYHAGVRDLVQKLAPTRGAGQTLENAHYDEVTRLPADLRDEAVALLAELCEDGFRVEGLKALLLPRDHKYPEGLGHASARASALLAHAIPLLDAH